MIEGFGVEGGLGSKGAEGLGLWLRSSIGFRKPKAT